MSKRAGYLWNRLVKIVLEIVKLALIWSIPGIGWVLVIIFILIDLKLVKKEKVAIFLTALAAKIKWQKGQKLVIKIRDKWFNKT